MPNKMFATCTDCGSKLYDFDVSITTDKTLVTTKACPICTTAAYNCGYNDGYRQVNADILVDEPPADYASNHTYKEGWDDAMSYMKNEIISMLVKHGKMPPDDDNVSVLSHLGKE